MYRIHEIKLNIDENWDAIPRAIEKKLKKKDLNIANYNIIKESIDARDKRDIKLVYSVDFESDKTLDLPEAPNMNYVFPEVKLNKDSKIVIVGFGPCGIFAGLLLAQMGYKPLIIERGKKVDERTKDVELFWNDKILDENSNVQFGEGGAGTFSDGKLTTGIKDPRIRKVLEEFHKFGADKNILYKQKAHIGTDVLKDVVKNIRKEIINLGGEIRFSTKLENIFHEDGKIKEIEIIDLSNKNAAKSDMVFNKKIMSTKIPCDKLIIATGHSSRDTFKMLYDKGINFQQKLFSMGVRIEHPQEVINKAQYGDSSLGEKLGAAEYKLNYKAKDGRGVYTFCMCPGGEVILASSSNGTVVTNGMSYHARDGKFANSGLLVDIKTSDFASDYPLAGMEFQEKYEKLAFEVSNSYDFVECKYKDIDTSYLYKCLPKFVVDDIKEAIPQMAKKLKGFDMPDAILKGIESRSSSPVRILRGEDMQCNIKGIYPAGEGAGYAGGIVSAAVDGIKVAETIISKI